MHDPLAAAAGPLVTALAEIDPLAVVRALARGLRRQTAGAKAALVRRLADELDAADPGCLRELATGLALHYVEKE